MKRLSRWFYRLLIWAGPLLVLLLMVLSGFLYWVLGTEPGTRWLLSTAARQMDGQVRDVDGSVLDGLRVGAFSLSLPDLQIALEDFRLQADWRALFDRRLHIQELSARSLGVELTTPPPSPDEEGGPLTVPSLPVVVTVDRLALGELSALIDGAPLPVSVADLDASLALSNAGGQLVLRDLALGHDMADIRLQGDLALDDVADPWPMRLDLQADALARSPDSPLCVPAFVPKSAATADQGGNGEMACDARLRLRAEGSLQALQVQLDGSGQGLSLAASAGLLPSAAFPLKDASIDLTLGDGASVKGDLAWAVLPQGDRLQGKLQVDRLDVGRLAGPSLPAAVLGLDGQFDVSLRDRQAVSAAVATLQWREGSRWNGRPLAGKVHVEARHAPVESHIAASGHGRESDANALSSSQTGQNGQVAAHAPSASEAAAPLLPVELLGWRLPALAVDLTLGENRVRLDGALGTHPQDKLRFDIQAPALAAFWPDLPGAVQAQGELTGGIARHALDVKARYVQSGGKDNVPGEAPADVSLALSGTWGASGQSGLEGWRGDLSRLQADHAGLRLTTQAPVSLAWVPGAPDWQWRVGAVPVQLALDNDSLLTLQHGASRGGHGRWETQGGIAQLHVTDARITQLRERFLPAQDKRNDRGGVTVSGRGAQAGNDIRLDLDWNLRFTDALEGKVSLRRVAGDLVIPSDTPVPVGLRELSLELDARRAAAGLSALQAEAVIRTERMGAVWIDGRTRLRATPGGGFLLEAREPKIVEARAEVADLGWLSMFADLPAELGGAITANVRAESRPDGQWTASGRISGDEIRVLYADEGVRLLDGKLSARVEDERIILESLRFPTRLRVEPKEWRTQEWVSSNPDAQGGSLTLSGEWNLLESVGGLKVDLHRYPILQRSDRYAMFTGGIQVDAKLPALAVTGKLTADAGWVDLDIVSGVPTVDGDVVVIRAGDQKHTGGQTQEAQASAPTDVSLDLTVDLGPRFYITGYGVNSGLVGSLRLLMQGGKLSAEGALRTRGGAIETYGQRLQLRRGTITFQGDLTSPVLDIEALRTGGVAVQAGVRVAGTARRPRIDLVSYPDVSEVAKLSWLLLGKGPDESGGDAALLFSVGTSFLGSGEPFYRRFGLDEVSMRSGALGATGSLLPVESVVRGLDSGTSEIERKFIHVSKNISRGFTVSVEQALSDTGTVGRIGYRLGKGVTAQLSVGTVNGLALVYRWVSQE